MIASDSEIRIGCTVTIRYGVETVIGVVKEDRGSIGVGGPRLHLITFHLSSPKECSIELPAVKLSVEHQSVP